MIRSVVLTLVFAVAYSAPAAAANASLTPAQALRELKILERGLNDLHPGLTRYQSAAGLAAEFERARNEVARGATPGQMYLLATRISASLRCGHTWTNPLNQGEAIKSMLASLPVLPLHARILQGRMLVTASTDTRVTRYDEVLAIDGHSIAELTAAMLPYLRADGSSDGKRLAQLDHNDQGGALDRLLPLLFPPQDGRYRLRLRVPNGELRDVAVSSQPLAEREAQMSRADDRDEDLAWHFDIRGQVAVMTLPTFAFWKREFDWRAFFDQSFARLQQQRVSRLILDVRQNEGGDAEIERALVGHLIDTTYAIPVGRIESAYERVPYDLARYLDTWDFGFFDRTGQVRRTDGRAWLPTEPPPAQQIVALAPRFRGKVFALIGPRMSSAGFLLARDLQATHSAVLVGEATGGNRRGLNGGELAWLTLPHSGVAVDIPLLSTVYDDQPDAPIQPDWPVATSVEDVIAGRDPAMAAAMALRPVPGARRANARQ